MTTFLRRIIAACSLIACLVAATPRATAAPGNPPPPVAGCPDGFTGPCCASAAPNLPAFPSVTWNDAKQTCWIDCGPQTNQTGQLILTAPVPAGCGGVYNANLFGTLLSCPPPAGSRLRLYYTRHWSQNFPSLGNVEVYRFVAVGNVCLAPGSAGSCQMETAPATPFVFGVVDYAFKTNGPPPCPLNFAAASLAVGHPCDRFVHDPACPFTADPRPPTHPLNQYVLVAPGSNFTPNANLTPPSGPGLNTANEAIRQLQPNTAGVCTTNEVFNSLQLTNVGRQCACVNPTLAQGPFWRQWLRSATKCGSTLDTSPICPFNYTPPAMVAPFPTLVAWSIGSWGPGQFPGTAQRNQFFLVQGSASYQRTPTAVCAPITTQRDVYYGVENQWPQGLIKGGKRVDLVDNAQMAVGSTTVTPVVGGPAPFGTQVVFFY